MGEQRSLARLRTARHAPLVTGYSLAVTHTQNHQTLRELLASPDASADTIAQQLDEVSHATRVQWLAGLRRPQLQALYRRVRDVAPLALEDMVPASLPPFSPVRHIGHNSLPLFSSFEKRFYRGDTPGTVFGANFQSTSILTGPGYFSATASASGQEVIIDYRTVPERAPAGWPRIRDNDHGLAATVYGGAVDMLRRVSRHVSIGAATKPSGQERPIVAYFVLCRQD